ncbi:hypothetical protein ATCC90586_002562 [Pythium insidiosum]|nr:hypothetical protein ATCC90586_002562 [Pythium insidiosum]
MPWRFLRMEEHFELIKANVIRCEECNENFFFDFLRHPRYFVTHFKTCHLKNLLYRFNGYSEEENQRVRFGPRRKRDANAWFGQLKSTEKRMISMQDNRWSEITEHECWSCRLCNDGKSDLTHVFDKNELGRGQAFLHLRQFHEDAYEAFLRSLPDVENAALQSLRARDILSRSGHATTTVTAPIVAADDDAPAEPSGPGIALAIGHSGLSTSSRTIQQRMQEAERSRQRRMHATPEERMQEAQRSKRRRENLTPAQRQADYDRRRRKKKRQEESERSRKRREEATEEMRQKEVMRSRERRRNATEEQRQREALRSRLRRQNATEEQKLKERERCRKRYEAKKISKQRRRSGDYHDLESGHSGDDDYRDAALSFSDDSMASLQARDQRGSGGSSPSLAATTDDSADSTPMFSAESVARGARMQSQSQSQSQGAGIDVSAVPPPPPAAPPLQQLPAHVAAAMAMPGVMNATGFGLQSVMPMMSPHAIYQQFVVPPRLPRNAARPPVPATMLADSNGAAAAMMGAAEPSSRAQQAPVPAPRPPPSDTALFHDGTLIV